MIFSALNGGEAASDTLLFQFECRSFRQCRFGCFEQRDFIDLIVHSSSVCVNLATSNDIPAPAVPQPTEDAAEGRADQGDQPVC